MEGVRILGKHILNHLTLTYWTWYTLKHITLSKLFALEIHLHPLIVLSMTCLSQNLMIMQIDTRDILFICGGAFVDLEKTISERYC
jgi:hypothetical protein